MNRFWIAGIWLLTGLGIPAAFPQSLFEGHGDVGTVLHPGGVDYDEAAKSYTVTGSGENMWFATDDFHFVWKKVSAENVRLAADIAILGTGGNNHRKAVLMIRQNLDADAAYADAAVHGDGLTSLQFRDAKGATTHEVESSESGPRRLGIEKRGDRFYLWLGNRFAGGSARVVLKSPFYVGIGVCAHDKDAIQKAAFLNVELLEEGGFSTIETISVSSTDARVSYVTKDHVEVPEFSEDGKEIVFRAGASIERVPLGGGAAQVATGLSEQAVNARISPDGKWIAVAVEGDEGMVLSAISVADGTMKSLAKFSGDRGSLSAHPWSPDSKRLVFVSYQTIESGDRPEGQSSQRR
jgi:TolB protein